MTKFFAGFLAFWVFLLFTDRALLPAQGARLRDILLLKTVTPKTTPPEVAEASAAPSTPPLTKVVMTTPEPVPVATPLPRNWMFEKRGALDRPPGQVQFKRTDAPR